MYDRTLVSESERDRAVRVSVQGPVVLIYHEHPPDEEQARNEVAALRRGLVEGGGRAVLLWVADPLPPPPVAAMRLYRDLIAEHTPLELVAIVFPTSGFSLTIGAAIATQLFRLTRLSAAMKVFTSLGDALEWLEPLLGLGLDDDAIVAQLQRLRGA